MKRFEFRLESVLKFKQRREQLAELRQLQARAAWDAAQAEVDRLRGQLDRLAEQMQRGGDGRAWIAGQKQAVLLSPLLDQAAGLARQAEQQYQEAAAQRTQIAQEVEALLQLRRDQLQAHQHEVARAQQEQLDEVSLRRWLAARADNPNEP